MSLRGGGALGEEARARRVWGSDATGSQEGGNLGLLERGGRDRALDQGYWPPPGACLQTRPPHTTLGSHPLAPPFSVTNASLDHSPTLDHSTQTGDEHRPRAWTPSSAWPQARQIPICGLRG